jgi:hypothetical protein
MYEHADISAARAAGFPEALAAARRFGCHLVEGSRDRRTGARVFRPARTGKLAGGLAGGTRSGVRHARLRVIAAEQALIRARRLEAIERDLGGTR